MRLTLRTMLAFLDDILKPEDAQVLGKKVEESEFAKGLVDRIRSSTRRPRLGAPSLVGKGMGLDPNTVAEYLDNVLPADRVPQLEKVCLESDVHLAEIAASHQILALVLGKPTEAPPKMRDRCYLIGSPDSTRRAPRVVSSAPAEGLGAMEGLAAPPVTDPQVLGHSLLSPEPPPVLGNATDANAPLDLVTPAADHKHTVVPEYLRASRNARWKPIAITLVLAFALSAVALRAMGPFDGTHPLMRMLGLGSRTETVAQAPVSDAGDAAADPDGEPAEPDTPATDAGRTQDSSQVHPEPFVEEVGREMQGDVEDGPPTTVPATDAATVLPSPDGSATEPAALGADDPDASADGGTTFPKTTPAAPGEDLAEDGTESEAAAQGIGGMAEEPAQVPVEVGYVKDSGQHFLVRLDVATDHWFRLPGRAKLMSGDNLLVLPTYRPEIVLTGGVQAVLVGPCEAQPQPVSAAGEPGLTISTGRAFISTAGVAGARLRLNLGGYPVSVTFTAPDSELAIDVQRYLAPGADPQAEELPLVVHAFASVGRIDWEADDGTVVTIDQGQVRLILGDRAETLAVSEFPAWMRREGLRNVDRMASLSLEPALPIDRPAVLSLKEQAENRRSEVRSLAARSLAYLGSFETLVAEFNNEDQRSYWTSEFDVLRDAVARSPVSAQRVKETLDRSAPDEAEVLFQMICGLSPQQLIDGADETLVQMLNHSSLSVRVMAFENLSRITGKTLYYRPENTEARRRSTIQDWQAEAENGAIQYGTRPGPQLFGT